MAVGDIAMVGGPQAKVAALAASVKPSRVLLAGDESYPSGTLRQFERVFDPSWGRFRSIWLPVPGNHEYYTAKAAGYRKYFGEKGGLYWSRKVGSWRVIGLDSERASSRAQKAFLRRTLAKFNGAPTLVMWHRPRYSRGWHGDQKDTAGLFNIVKRDRDVKLMVWGHDHDYERMLIPVTGRSTRLPAFVVGTGGGDLRCATTHPGRKWSRVFDCHTHGVLALRLRPRSFTWRYLTIGGRTLDHGTRRI